MTEPQRPSRFQQQGPASNCIIGGQQLGWLSCTCFAGAHGVDKASMGRIHASGCGLREATGDKVAGTTIPQVQRAIAETYNMDTTARVGSNVIAPPDAAVVCLSGRGFVLQGDAGALTEHRSTGGDVNHAVYVNEVRGPLSRPDKALVYDPAADGRKAGWGTADQGPSWWDWEEVLAFAAALHPWGDARRLGRGKFYALFFPDTEPHFHTAYGGRRASPMPDRMRVNRKNGQWRYKTPAYGTANRVGPKLADNELFIAYQYTTRGGREWGGNHDGTQWTPLSSMSHVGGLTMAQPHELDLDALLGAKAALTTMRLEAPDDAADLPSDVRDGDIGQYE